MDIIKKPWQNLSMEDRPNDVTEENQDPEENIFNRFQSQSIGEGFAKIPKRKGELKTPALIIVFLLLALITAALYILSQDPQPETQIDEDPPEIIITKDPQEITTLRTYQNDVYGLSVEYDTDIHRLRERVPSSDQISIARIEYLQNRPENLEKETDLEEGYLLKIAVFEGIDREIQDLIERKKEKFKVECPAQATIGKTYSTTIDGIDGSSFEVINCPQDYIVNLINFGGRVFEITQVYRGDIGFKQSYKAQTESLIDTVSWYREKEFEKTESTIRNTRYGIEITHPLLDIECCEVTQPSLENLTKIAVLANFIEGQDPRQVSDKFGVFGYDGDRISFDLFLNQQKQTLIQEYRVVEEKDPTGLRESRVFVGGQEALKLQNYAWWGELTYVEHPFSEKFIIIVVPHGISSSFSETIERIQENINFLDQ